MAPPASPSLIAGHEAVDEAIDEALGDAPKHA
jgi:hypothetical protein